MATSKQKLSAAVTTYFTEIARVRSTGAGTGELSYYPALDALLRAVGATLKPKVYPVNILANQGAGHPDFGLYTARQMQKGQPRKGQIPASGVVEVKSADEEVAALEVREQTERYWRKYRLVLVTNLREFALVGDDGAGGKTRLESFRLATSEAEFNRQLEKPRSFASNVGVRLAEYLCRALSRRAALTEPKDLAGLLASYARDGLARVEEAGDKPSLATVRTALEDALGIRFEGKKGARFFHSTLVQTLFYGIFSAWVLWARQPPSDDAAFRWREAVWYLRAPVIRALFQQLSDPGRLQPLNLVELLDWTAAALDRVDRPAFFSRFNEDEAVQYFYEPFLEAFDPEIRKQLGVWYTPTEVVRYMVARVDHALKRDLHIAEGLAAENVYVLDPCCGTGAFLAEVLRRIAANLEGQGRGALVGAQVRQAATERVFGFEIMPAPFVVAHLQVGLTLQNLDAPFADDGAERAGIYLTNALTGWEPTTREKQLVAFPEMAAERDRANKVKRDRPILVILGNPPYDGHPGVAVGEERELTDAYRVTRRVRRPEGRGLNELYVRFFRMAERRIVDKTGQGLICFVSNYSWLDGLSHTGMRERYLEVFDVLRIDCLNGDEYRTGKVAPDGSPDPSIFSTESDPVGVQVGTAIATLVRKADHVGAREVAFRHLWGPNKPATLLDSMDAEPDALYRRVEPILPLGLPFQPTPVMEEWFDWPGLTELFPTKFHGVLTNRDAFLVDIDLERLKGRVRDYFDPALSHAEIERRYPAAMKSTARFDAKSGRDYLLKRGGPDEAGFMRIAYRPFDSRWLYWEAETKLLDEKRADYKPHVFKENLWLSAAQHLRQGATEPQTAFVRLMGSHHLIERGANLFPSYLRGDGIRDDADGARRANLTDTAQRYLDRLSLGVEDLFHHVVATLHDPAYREANAGALRMEWPRIPLPGWPDGNAEGAAEELARSAARGRKLAALLDPDKPVPGVTQAPLQPNAAAVAVPATTGGRHMVGENFAVTAGWGYRGQGDAVMPGQGRAVERSYTTSERASMGDTLAILGETTFDIFLNQDAFWRNVPATVWGYRLGGYQVLKKWLSYRERGILGRPLSAAEIQHFTDTARRIASIAMAAARDAS